MKQETLDAFERELIARLDKGEIEYGDRSWSKEPLVLLREIKEELVDVAGWSVILWARIGRLEELLRAIQAEKK